MIGFREIVIFLLPFRFGIPQVTLRTIPQVKVGWLTWLDPEKMVVIGRFTLGLLVGHFLRCVQADAQIQQGFPVVGKEGKKKKQDRINMIDMMKGGGASANPVNHVHPV